jgi:hypothetical protein
MLIIIKIAVTMVIVGSIGAGITQEKEGRIRKIWAVFIGMLIAGFAAAVIVILAWMWLDF